MTPQDEHRVHLLIREEIARLLATRLVSKAMSASSHEEAVAILRKPGVATASKIVARIKQEIPHLRASAIKHIRSVIAAVSDEMLADAYRQEGQLQ
jgi:hypothetical protein